MRKFDAILGLLAALAPPAAAAAEAPSVTVVVTGGSVEKAAFDGGELTLKLTNTGAAPVSLAQRFPAAPAVEYVRGGVPFREAGSCEVQGPAQIAPGATVEWKVTLSPGILAGAPTAPGPLETVQVRLSISADGGAVVSPSVAAKVGGAALDHRFALDLPLAVEPLPSVPTKLASSLSARAAAELRRIAAGQGEPSRAPALASLLAALGARSEAGAVAQAVRAPGLEVSRGALLRALGQLGGSEASAIVLQTLREAKRFDGKEAGVYQVAVQAAARLKLGEAAATIEANLPLLPPRGDAIAGSLDALVQLQGPAAVPAAAAVLSRALAPAEGGSRSDTQARQSTAGDAAFALCKLGASKELAAAVALPTLSAAAPWDAEVTRALALAGKGPACDAVKHRALP